MSTSPAQGDDFGRGLQRSVSNAHRAVLSREDIVDAKSLISALNRATDPLEMKAIRDWVQRYIELFVKLSKESIELMTVKDVREYAFIGQLVVRGPRDTWLLEAWFSSLGNAILYGRHGEEKILAALECALLCVDKSIFKGNSTQLLRLSSNLLSKLDPTKTSFSKETHETHRATLCALHQIFIIIQEIAPKSLNPNSNMGLYQTFKRRLQEIKDDQTYYPFVYLVELIRQSIQKLEHGENIPKLAGALRRLFHGAWGALCVVEGVCGLTTIEFRRGCFETGYENLREAFKRVRIDQKSWYDWLQALSRAALASIEYPENYAEFVDCFDALAQKSRSTEREERIALRFGMVDQLVLLILQSSNSAVRSGCLEKLLHLAERSEYDGWAADVEVFEALLDALSGVHGFVDRKQEIETAMEIVTTTFKTPAVQATSCRWLEGSSLEAKLSSMHVEQEDERDHIFPMVVEEIKKADINISSEFCEELKLHYERSEFAEVSSLFDNEKAKHVASLQFSWVRYKEAERREQRDQDDHTEEHHERKNLIRVPIHLDELFKRRKLKKNGMIEEIRVVLAVGDPGTGKTSTSKKLAYMWAIGKWGKKFETVYVLPVRRLDKTFYDGCSRRKATTLACAIANILYGWRDNEAYSALCKHIADELKKSTTLLILDGLDEGADACEPIVNEAKRCACKLLMLSRPYNLHHERAIADFEVECLGLDDKQLDEFIKEELPDKSGVQLVSHLKANSSIWSIAHVPVTANILCVLWKEERDAMTTDGKQLSLLALYKRMTRCMWKRYVKKYGAEHVNQNEIFRTLEKIAFVALKSGEILINQSLVHRCVPNGATERILKESGFLLLQLEGNQYQFPHFTFEEYFAGVHAATVLYNGTPLEVRETERFISQNKYLGKYNVMLSFMAEEVRSVNGPEGFGRLISVIDNEPRDIAGWQHVVLKVTVLKAFYLTPIKNDELSGQEDVCVHQSMEITQGVLAASQSEDENLRKSAVRQIPGVIGAAPQHADALIGRMMECLQDEDWNVRRSTAKQIPDVIGAGPQHADALVKKLMECLQDASWEVRESAFRQIPDVIEVVPEHGDKLIGKLMECLKDADGNVRRPACEQIPGTIRAAPQHVDALIGKLVECLKDADENVRRSACEQIPGAIRAAPQHADALIRKLVECLQDADWIICQSAAQQIPGAIRVAPHHADVLIGRMMDCLKDADENVRQFACEQIPGVILEAPQHADALIGRMMDCLKDADGNICRSVARQISGVIKATPQHAELIGKLSQCLKDAHWNVYQSALEQIPGLIEAATQNADALIGKLNACLKDADRDVRRSATEQIPGAIRSAPQHADKLIGKLMECLKDADRDVRRSAFEQINGVIKAAPQHIDKFIEKLNECLMDADRDVRRAAVTQIAKSIESAPACSRARVIDSLLSLYDDDNEEYSICGRNGLRLFPGGRLVDHFWKCKDHRLVPWLADAFFKSPFVVTYNDLTSSATLALKGYASNKEEWTRPVSEIEDLLQLVRQTILLHRQALAQLCVWKPRAAEASRNAENETNAHPINAHALEDAPRVGSFLVYFKLGILIFMFAIGVAVMRFMLRIKEGQIEGASMLLLQLD